LVLSSNCFSSALIPSLHLFNLASMPSPQAAKAAAVRAQGASSVSIGTKPVTRRWRIDHSLAVAQPEDHDRSGNHEDRKDRFCLLKAVILQLAVSTPTFRYL
jgi:hypothetical protein